MATVLVTPPVLLNKPGEYSRILERAGLSIKYPDAGGRQMVLEQVFENLAGVDAVLAGPEPYTAEVMDEFPSVRALSRAGVGYDAIDMAAANQRKVAVCFTPGTNHDAVAEHTFSMLLGCTRRLVDNHLMVTGGEFRRNIVEPMRGKTLGILGVGRIGRAVAVRARAFGMTLVTFDPYADATQLAAEGIESITLDQLLARSDYITLHSPLTEETRHLVRAETIAKMKDGVVLVNTARGGLVDENALTEALRSGKVAAAGLDVFEKEPPAGSPLLEAPNTLLTPHVAAMDTDSVNQMTAMAAQTIVDLYEGRWPADRVVNAAEIGPDWKW